MIQNNTAKYRIINTRSFPGKLAKAQGLQGNVCRHFSRCIPWGLASVCQFRHQSLTLKCIEIGLLIKESDYRVAIHSRYEIEKKKSKYIAGVPCTG